MATATTATVRRGFPVACLSCGERDTTHVGVHDVSVVTCSSCDTETDLAEIEDRLAEWAALVNWLKSAPEYTEDA